MMTLSHTVITIEFVMMCKNAISPLFCFLENEDKLLWNPGLLTFNEVESYLAKSQETVQSGGVGSLPLGAHVRDDEQVHRHNSNLEKLFDIRLFSLAGPISTAAMRL